MRAVVVWVVLGALATLTGGCAWKSEVDSAKLETTRATRELAEARQTRDQYRSELTRVQGQVDEQAGKARQAQAQADKLQADLKKTREQATLAEQNVAALT